MNNLLPPNTTELERAIAAVTSGIEQLPSPIRTLYNAHTCPIALLPWLAWAYSVDQWDDNWSEAQQRETVAKAILVHQKKGTPFAVKTAVAALGYQLELVEWFETNGEHEPGTFGIEISLESSQSLAATQTIINTVNRTKNARSHLWGLSYRLESRGQQFIGAAQSFGLGLDVQPMQHNARIEMWAGELDTLPEGYLVCDGSALERELYPDLYFALGRTYNAPADDPALFRLPDLRGRALLGVTSSAEVGGYVADKLMRHEHGITTASPYKAGGAGGIHPLSSTAVGDARAKLMRSWEYVKDRYRDDIYPYHLGFDTRMKNIGVYFILNTNPAQCKNAIGEIAFNPSRKLTLGSLPCDGRAISRASYAALFAAIGTQYGDGDGISTFNLPNIDDIYVRGTPLGSSVDPDRASRLARPDGATGDIVGTRQLSAIRSHKHGITGKRNSNDFGFHSFNYAMSVTIEARGILNFNPKNTNYTVAGGALDDNEEWSASSDFANKNYMRSVRMQAVIFYEA